MPTTQLDPTRVAAPNAKLVQFAQRLLERVVAASDTEVRWYLFDTLLDRVKRSLAYTDAAFAAAQALRDSNVIEPAGAVWVFDTFWNVWKVRFQDTDAEVQREKVRLKARCRKNPSRSDVEASLAAYEALLDRVGWEMMIEFYRARGEAGLADLALSDPEGYASVCMEGFSFIDGKGAGA